MKKYLLIISLAISTAINIAAQDFVTVAKDGFVYDEPNAKYITVNQDNEDVKVIPGMVFKTNQHTPGWYKVEYSPGLHAFIPEQIAATSFNPVKSGTYELVNQPGQKIEVNINGDNSSALINGKSYKGKIYQDLVVFSDDSGNISFTLVDVGNGPIAITYSNDVTKFF